MVTVPQATDQRGMLLRYNNGAIAIHWVTVLLVLAQLYIGFAFSDMPRGPERGELFIWHKTVGATILVLSLVRLGWRLAHKAPPFPEELPRWERIVAVWNHRAFYALLILLPLTGLATVSAGRSGTTALVGGIPLPLIPGLPDAAGDAFGSVHEVLVFVTLALVVLHVGAALKHQFVDRAGVAGRMPSFRAQSDEAAQPPDR